MSIRNIAFIRLSFLLILCVFSANLSAGLLTSINSHAGQNNTQVVFKFDTETKYSYFRLNNPERLVIDFHTSSTKNHQLLPKNLTNTPVKRIRTSTPPKKDTLRVVLELTNSNLTHSVNKQNNNVLIDIRKNSNSKTKSATITTNRQQSDNNKAQNRGYTGVLTIAIDAGHGGKDPGAIGKRLNIYEKNVTLQIAKELKSLLDKDHRFRGVLTRTGDYFISVPDRSEIARKNKANYLISIHADANRVASLRGASVWVLSNRRASTEMGRWLEDHEKQSELLGGAGNVLANNNEKYLDQTVLDLQFSHSQRAAYQLGQSILQRFGRFAKLSRKEPQHASLGVLRSPDIPSVLVETGFLSNPDEEKKLATSAYRKQVANAIYQGLIHYYQTSGEANNK